MLHSYRTSRKLFHKYWGNLILKLGLKPLFLMLGTSNVLITRRLGFRGIRRC